MAIHEASIFENATFWALVALIIFLLILIYLKIPAMLGQILDNRADVIKKDLEEARLLREEARKLLRDYQNRHNEAEKEAAIIIENAKREAKLLTEEANRKLEAYIAAKQKAAEEKIARSESELLDSIKILAADIAVEAASKTMAEHMDQQSYDEIFNNSLSSIKRQLN